MNNLTIAITGAGGLIGSKLSHIVSKEFPNYSVIGVGKRALPADSQAAPNYEYISCDLLEGEISKKLPERVDILIHLAGDRRSFINAKSYTSQAVSNINMTLNLADYAVAAKTGLFIFPSSGYVYSGSPSLPSKEDNVGIPIENLGATKMATEALLKARAYSGQFNLLTLRVFTVYGPGSRHDQFIPQAIMKLRAPEPAAIFGAPDVKRDFIFVDDVVRSFKACIALSDRDKPYEVFNVGTGVQTTIRKAVLLLSELIGTEKQIEFTSDSRKNDRTDIDHQADITKIRSVLGWQPEVNLRTGLQKTLDSFAPVSGEN